MTYAKLAARIDAVAETLRIDNNAAEEDAMMKRERQLDRDLKSYIVDSRKAWAWGGIVNLLGTIADIMEQQSRLEGDDYEKAARLIEDCAHAVDIKYEVSDGQAD